jgi:asparagine synthase (glutamine-hydrolysing)
LTNRSAIAQQLAARGSVREQSCDASLALDAYLEYGAGCFSKLEGTWGLVLWDGRTRELQVSRDRLGVCPLYYFEGPPLIVASEIKAILALENRARVPNLARVWRYLPEGAIDDWSETFFLGVRPVPPATVLR